jgi:hypothetical protein
MGRMAPLSMDEAAGALGVSRRALQEILKRHPHYYPNGKRKLFTEADIAAISRAMGRPAQPKQPIVHDPFSRLIEAGDLSWMHELAAQARKRAAKAGIPYSLTTDDLITLDLRSKRKCELSGVALDFTIFRNGKRNPFRPSIDRKDNAKGYEIGNVRIVCSLANFAMNEWGEEPLRLFVAAMAGRIGR